MILLGIETSCDETAISVVEAKGDLESLDFKLLSSAIHSQIEMHREYGGVVPRLAKREHIKNLPIVLEQALKQAESLELKAKSKENKSLRPQSSKLQALSFIDMIAVTVGPGLEPALWTGIKFAEELGQKWNIPVLGVNHMEGHIASVLLNKTEEIPNSKNQITNKKLEFPTLALLISGGHTELVLLNSWKEKTLLGETVDDAVGEAFDKVARMLGLPYPGGPEISRLAEQARSQNISLDTKLPRPMIHSKDLNFSFSGLKTAVLYYLRDLGNSSRNELNVVIGEWREAISETKKLAIAREFEDAVTEVLVSKTQKAIEQYQPKYLIIGGGVSANKNIIKNIKDLTEKENIALLLPEKELSTDNATMIAISGYIDTLIGKKYNIKADGNLSTV